MNKKELEAKIDSWLEKERDNYVRDVIGAVNIPSVSQKTEGKFPYGKECAKMLDYMKKITDKYEFSFENHEYQCATSLIKGETEKYEIGLFGHTDVVAPGEGWSSDPFCAYEKDGHIYGRGSNDNKGSVFACIYAMRFLKENGIKLKNNVRLFFGANEEAGMEDMKYYLKHHKTPDYTLVADSWFPVSASEKGRYVYAVKIKVDKGNVVKFYTADATTTIPDKCTIVLKDVPFDAVNEKASDRDDIEVNKVSEGIEIIAKGVGNHPAFPDGTVNAIKVCIDFVLENGFVVGEISKTLANIANSLSDYYGKALNVHFEDDFAGTTTHVITRAKLVENVIELEYMICYPATPSVDKEVVRERLIEFFKSNNMEAECLKDWSPHYVDVNHEIVKILCDNSSEVYGQKMKPFAMAGGTYTWVVPNSFAAGPNVMHISQELFKEPGHGFPHQPDECMKIDVWLKGIKIYILSLIEIDNWLAHN